VACTNGNRVGLAPSDDPQRCVAAKDVTVAIQVSTQGLDLSQPAGVQKLYLRGKPVDTHATVPVVFKLADDAAAWVSR
jgi:hypothetical protein